MGKLVSRMLVVVALSSLTLAGCARTDDIRTVQVDYRHDDFAAAFNAYFPKKLSVHPGQTVRFENSWSGEPHNVLLGRVVDDLFEYSELFEQYESEEAARAGGVTDEVIDEVNATFARIPGMTVNGFDVYPPGAKPCFITKMSDVPAYPMEGEKDDPAKTRCSEANSEQRPFTGRQALFNSGLIPFQGKNANVFTMEIAEDATPGTYNYFCTYHWLDMSGTITVVPETKAIPSRSEVIAQARKEIEKMERPYVAQVRKATRGDFGNLRAPVAGLPVPEDAGYAWVNEFYPGKVEAKAGEPVTWGVHGSTHTISFNVPSYFPVFAVNSRGDVVNDDRVDKPVGWDVPEPVEVSDGGPPPARTVDVGKWDGGRAFRSSGLLFDGDTFTVTFTKPGSYPYACLLHPAMIGTVKVSA